MQPPLSIPVGNDNACTPNFRFWTLGTRTQYNPLPWLDLGFDVSWTHLDTPYSGTGVTLGSNGSRPAGVYSIGNQDVLTALVRAQINFQPGQ